MPEYYCKRPSAQWHSLKGEDVEPFRAMRIYAASMGKGRILTDTVIVNLILDHGVAKAEDLVNRFVGRGFFSLDKLQGLIDGTESRTFEAPVKSYQNEMPGRQRMRESNATKTVGGFLDQLAINPNRPAPIEKPKRVPLPPGWMLREAAIEWMKENHPDDIHLIDQFFKQGSLQGYDEVIYVLQARVSQ